MNLDEAFPSKYLKSDDLPDEGSQAFTITGAEIESIGRDKDKKLVLSFEEESKGLICNKTNSNTIAKLAGSKETDDWKGLVIHLYRAEVEFQGDMVESIRVRIKAPAKSAKAKAESGPVEPPDVAPPAKAEPDDDEIPF